MSDVRRHTGGTGTRRRSGRSRASPRAAVGSRRAEIIAVATDYFGRYGYEETKWADVADAVGIGSTALYHYFDSKQHCLYEIMSLAIARKLDRFDQIVAEHPDWTDALVALLVAGFDLSDTDVLEHRVLISEHGRVGFRRGLPREESAREGARSRKRDLESAWTAFLARGMQEGALPGSDPQLLARALLGLYNSVWVWYRPGGALGISDVGRFFVARELELLGCDPSLAADGFLD
jgi:TetR/AcrR family transcriptional regulator, cholesterol catabolism regulator